jgi:hypothetical protein
LSSVGGSEEVRSVGECTSQKGGERASERASERGREREKEEEDLCKISAAKLRRTLGINFDGAIQRRSHLREQWHQRPGSHSHAHGRKKLYRREWGKEVGMGLGIDFWGVYITPCTHAQRE